MLWVQCAQWVSMNYKHEDYAKMATTIITQKHYNSQLQMDQIKKNKIHWVYSYIVYNSTQQDTLNYKHQDYVGMAT
jgi:hypothetical protein